MRTKITLLLFSVALFAACSVENNNQEPIIADRLGDIPVDDGVTNDEPVLCSQVDLIAGQNETIGAVSVYTDGITVTVCYETVAGWTVDATHLYIGDCADRPSNNPGNPLIGQFPYSADHSGATVFCYEIDQSTLPAGLICVAAHAEAEGTSSETAWGCCLPYGGSSWAMYFEVDLSNCLPAN